MTFTTESSNQNLVVFLYKVKTTILGYESGDFFAVLDQLNTNAFADGRVGLFGLDTDLKLKNYLFLNVMRLFSTPFRNQSYNTELKQTVTMLKALTY